MRLASVSNWLTHIQQMGAYQQCIDNVRTNGYLRLMEFAFNPEKNELLRRKRGVTFPMIIEAIAEKGVLLEFAHPNQAKYPGQRIMVVELEGYVYCVPYVTEGDTWFLKTIYPSRQFKYLLEGEHDG